MITIPDESTILEEIAPLPIHEHAFLNSGDVIFSDEVRRLCEQNACGVYGKSWTCPPAVGSLEDCKEQCLQYDHVFMFTTVTKVKDSYDMEGWADAQKEHDRLTDTVAALFRSHFNNTLNLSTGNCTLCETCTYPDAPCRFPDRMYPGAEGYGIFVMEQAKLSNIRYINGANTVTLFSMIFF